VDNLWTVCSHVTASRYMADERSLKAAAAVAPLVSANRLSYARDLKAWTQDEVAQRIPEGTARAGLSAAALSQLERGRTRPSARTVLALAEVYGCPPEFFIDRSDDVDPAGFFRSLRSAPARERRQHLARARLLHDFVGVVEDHIQLPVHDVPTIRLRQSDPLAVEAAADQIRQLWGIGPGPVDNVVRELERHGVVVVRLARFQNEVDAFSVRFAQRPVVVLGADKRVTARSRFDAAHELGHLVLHVDEDAGTKLAESQAHEFAAAFLMPAAEIRDELPDRMDLRALMTLKVKWRVSIQSLLMRARTLGIMTPQRYVSSMKMISAKGWRTREPGDERLGALEVPKLLRTAIDRLDDVGYSLQDICVEGALPLDEIKGILDRTADTRPQIEL